ncbi:MAG TPA: phosphate ABC transporter permease subunit PstC [Streptosporangiaceae bacterium]|nr:phosphate ABC transporter permease subunit PstC [Streptosporangiaceae bacterium]
MPTSADVLRPEGEAGKRPLPRRLGAALGGDNSVRWVGFAFALLPAAGLLFVLVTLVVEAIPAIRLNGWGFFAHSIWSQGGGYNAAIVKTNGVEHLAGSQFSVLAEIVGTLLTSAIALIIAVPVSIGAALIIVERLPRRLASLVGGFLELLAGIPSVVVGLWGALTFGPFIAHHIAPFIAHNMPDVPVLNYFRGSTGNGQGLLVSSLVLAVMVIPIVAATSRDLIRQVPILPREGAVALGMSDFECARRVTLPWVGSGIIGAVVLGLGRALGETIAVAMTCGFALGSIPGNIYGAMTTIAATIVTELDSAFGDASKFSVRTLAELALVLMIITLSANIVARLLVRKVSGTALPVGRGL